jgi:hypothetical protein
MSTRSRKIMFLGSKAGRCIGLTTLPPPVSRLFRQCGILNISQPYRPPRPVTRINSVVWVRERTIQTERPPLVGKVSANFLADRESRVVSATDPHGRILRFIDRSHYYFFQVAPQLYSRGWVDPVPDPLLLRNSGSAVNRTRTSGSVARNADH